MSSRVFPGAMLCGDGPVAAAASFRRVDRDERSGRFLPSRPRCFSSFGTRPRDSDGRLQVNRRRAAHGVHARSHRGSSPPRCCVSVRVRETHTTLCARWRSQPFSRVVALGDRSKASSLARRSGDEAHVLSTLRALEHHDACSSATANGQSHREVRAVYAALLVVEPNAGDEPVVPDIVQRQHLRPFEAESRRPVAIAGALSWPAPPARRGCSPPAKDVDERRRGGRRAPPARGSAAKRGAGGRREAGRRPCHAELTLCESARRAPARATRLCGAVTVQYIRGTRAHGRTHRPSGEEDAQARRGSRGRGATPGRAIVKASIVTDVAPL